VRSTLPLALAATLAVVCALVACGAPRPPLPPPDASTPVDAGQDAGVDAGGEVDAGDPAQACDVAAQDCEAGALCLPFQDGARAGTACFMGGCDLLDGGCALVHKCAYAPVDGGGTERRCVAAGDDETGAPCTGTAVSDTCVAGNICLPQVAQDGGVENACRRFCYRDGDCGEGQLCFGSVELDGTVERPRVCEDTCDLLVQDCPAGRACYPGPLAPGCYPAGTMAVGGACTWSDECVPGAACTAQGSCVALCGTDGSHPCAQGSCTPLSLPNATGVGACF
jgi:predicted small lipoprotein YifL